MQSLSATIKRHILLFSIVAFQLLFIRFGASEPRKFALVIGITKYLHPRDQDVEIQYAAKDAEAFRNFLLTPSGGSLSPGNIKFLIDDEARRESINGGIKWLKDRVKSTHDSVYVYISGHAMLVGDSNARLIPYDGSDADSLNDWISLTDFVKQLNDQLDPKDMAIFLDMCHTGAAIFPQNLGSQIGRNRLIFASAGAQQKTRESRELGSSIFTHYLINALRQAAVPDADGNILASAVVPWVTDQVSAHALREHGAEQKPVASPNFTPGLVLAKRIPASSPEQSEPAPAPQLAHPPPVFQPAERPVRRTALRWGLVGGIGVAATVVGVTVGLVVGLHPCFGCLEKMLTY